MSAIRDKHPVEGAGLGLRLALLDEIEARRPARIDFIEVAPENWIGVGGPRRRRFERLLEDYPLVCHGLSLNIGGPEPLDTAFLERLRRFLDETGARCYTEHLSWCADDGQLYDLMPIPFTEAAVHHVAARIRQVQDILGRRIGMENVSTYAMPEGELSEIEFLCAVLEEADCGLHLDINNIHVNAVNHGFDAHDYLERIPAGRILYAHVAGHHRAAPDLCIDTHGEDVIDAVWSLLDRAYARHGVFPTLLERDFDLPPLDRLLGEVDEIRRLQRRHAERDDARVA